MALEERLELDVEEALRSVDTIEEALTSAAQAFKVGLAEALDLLAEVAVGEVDAATVTTGIDAAVDAANLEPTIGAEASGVTGAIDDAVGAADTDLTLDADASGVTSAIDAALAGADDEVTINAITDEITANIEAAVADADATVVVEGDTSGLTDSLSEAGQAGSEGAEGLGDFGAAAEQVQGAAGLATGDIANMSATLGAITPKGSAATAAILATVGGLTGLVDSAIRSEAATQRFERSLGDMAERVNKTGVTGLADDLGELAQKTGNSASAIRIADARLADLGNSAGASQEDIAGAAEKINLLAIRASVLTPSLGEAGEIADRMTNAFARGGRALLPYGIALSSAEINARALADTGKDTADELTFFEKAAAGAALATERLGGRLQSDIVSGSQSTEVQLRSLQKQLAAVATEAGKPLLEPFLQAAKESLPILVDIGGAFGELAAVVLPLVVDLFHSVAPAIHGITEAGSLLLAVLAPVVGLIDSIPEPLLQVVAAALVFNKVLGVMGDAIGGLLVRLGSGGIAAGLAGLINPITLAAVALGGLIAVISAHNAERAKEKAAIKEVSDAFLDESKNIEADIDARVRSRLESKNQIDDLLRVGLSVREVSVLATSGAKGYKDFLDTLARTGEIAPSVRDAILEQGLSLSQIKGGYDAAGVSAKDAADTNFGLIESFQNLAKETQAGADAALQKLVVDEKLTKAALDQAIANNTAKDGTVDYVGALREVAPTSKDAADASDQFSGQLDTEAQKAKDAEDALNRLLDAQIGFLDSTIAAETAARTFSEDLADVKVKTDELAEAQRTHGRTSSEAAAAQKDLDEAIRNARDSALAAAEAQLRLADDQAAASDKTLTPIERQKIFRDALQAVADKAGPTGPVRDAINGLITTYDRIPPAKTTKIDVDTFAANAKLDAFLRKLNSGAITARDFEVPGSRFDNRMSGGALNEGWTWLGEGGPELARKSGSDVMIFNAEESRRIAGGGPGSGSTFNIYPVTADPEETAFAVDARLGGRRR